jgi:hypothetical protein
MSPKPTEKRTSRPTPGNWQQMNRKQRREMTRKIQSGDICLEVVHADAAGIDIGNETHYVAVPPTRDSQPVRRFGCTTAELKEMAVWLKQCAIRTVAMQSTGVYWIAVYDILEQAGLQVYLVNARDTKNLPGRKSDVQESQWLMKLHTYGLLRNSFRPSQEIRTMRTYWRQRNDLVQSAGRYIQRMQKALTQMNIQLANVLSDVSGMTGQAIIKAILAGERDPLKLAEFRDKRVKASGGVWKAIGKKICCLCCSRNRMVTSFAKGRWPSAINESSSISKAGKTGVQEPVCRKKRERDGSRRREAISRGSTCLSHEWMLRFVEHRVGDPRLISLIRRWLKASILEDGEVHANEEGTPQGGSISVLLSNAYLHYVLDLWFERVAKPRLRGEAYLVRYIDDFVLCFQYRADALRVQKALCQRLGKFGLTLEPSKTKLVEFGRYAQRHASKRGRKRPETIYFLGFTLYCTRNRKGNFRVGAYGKVTPAACVDALARPDAADAALSDPGANRMPPSNAPRSLCVLRHRREHTGLATGPSGCGTLLAQNAEQPELARAALVEAISADQGSVSVVATKALSPLLGAASYRHAVKQLLTSVVREICMLRSVGAGERVTAPGHPVAASDGCPYCDQQSVALFASGTTRLLFRCPS